MDPLRFDQLTRVLSDASGRRAVLRAVLGAVLGGTVAETTAAKKKGQGQGQDQDRDTGKDQDRTPNRDQDRERLQAERRGKGKGKGKGKKKNKKKPGGSSPDNCCGTRSCATPEAGSLHDGCDHAGEDFAGRDLRGAQFEGIDGRETRFVGADLRGAHLSGACLQGASFRRARLHGALFGEACLFEADLTGADLGGESAVFNGALFCNTRMPDGRINDRDCDQATPCCQREAQPGPTCQTNNDCADEECSPCQTAVCQGGSCACMAVADGPDPSGQCGGDPSGHCCEGVCCQGTANQCNLAGLCCAPNCAGRECGPDGCGRGGTCGPDCPPNAECDDDGQCRGTTPCTAQSCPDGCCDANGVCRAGTSDAQCGRGGVPCVRCQAGQFCCSTPGCDQIDRRGQCACGGNSCPDGCCEDFTTCQPGTTNEFCGLGGLECITCNPNAGEVCAEVPVGEDRERLCICTPQTCPNGCCSGGPGNPGACFANRAPLCGIGGVLCQNCFNFQICNAQGQCVCSPQSCPRCQTCNAGTGQCQPLVCPPPADQCHVTGTCDPQTGQCSNPTVAHGTPCNDGNPLCINGQCCTTGHEVVHGGCFTANNSIDCLGCTITRLCQCFGSVEGSPFFLCGERDNSCSSNADCPFGQACASQSICIQPC
jgi:hypothetical protein